MPGSVKEGHKLSIVTAVYKISAFINREELQGFYLERHADSCKKPDIASCTNVNSAIKISVTDRVNRAIKIWPHIPAL